MSVAEIILSVVAVLAWPAVLVTALVLFRQEISAGIETDWPRVIRQHRQARR